MGKGLCGIVAAFRAPATLAWAWSPKKPENGGPKSQGPRIVRPPETFDVPPCNLRAGPTV